MPASVFMDRQIKLSIMFALKKKASKKSNAGKNALLQGLALIGYFAGLRIAYIASSRYLS